MNAILDVVINAVTIPIGFILGDIIHILHTPMGAVMAVSLLAYLEYITIKSIAKDMLVAVRFAKSYTVKNLPLYLKKVDTIHYQRN